MRSVGVLLLATLVLAALVTACQSDEPEPVPPSTPTAQGGSATQEATTEAEPDATPVTPTATEDDASEDDASAQSEDDEDGAAAEQTAQPAPAARSLEGVRGIVDPTNTGWPREVEGLNGIVTIAAKPARIITASVGHDEMVLALVPNERLVAVGSSTKNPTYSNVAHLVEDKAEISRDPEVILAETPDIVATSPYFPAEAADALQRAGITVIQTELRNTPEDRINNILLLGYILGEEERAFEFADEVRSRFEAVTAVTSTKQSRPSVLALTRYSDSLWVAGANSTESGVILAAGGTDAAGAAGLEGHQTTSLEGVIAIAPEVIIIAQPLEFGAEELRQSLLETEALAEVPAIENGAVHVVNSRHFTTLSFWNVRGAEDLARILWPDDFPEPAAESFSLAE
ncbi:MAG: ABC transporter substrate-binding protein [Chloroflexota bacterium]|nr:ABC transporter substrate-binding protein [Chloroflexota bacterium]